MCEHFNVKGVPQLADVLKITPNAIYRWIERGSIPGKKLNKKFPELNIHYLGTGEGQLLNDKKATDVDTIHPSKSAISVINDELVEYADHIKSLKNAQLPQDAALELLRSSIKLIQAYIDAVEAGQKGQQNNS